MKEFLLTVPAAIALDRATKYLAGMHLKDAGRVTLIPNVIGLRYAENTGAAFGAFSGNTVVLTALSGLLMLGVALYVLLNPRLSKPAKCGLWLIVAGGLGNLIDRIFVGYVVDFFELLFMRFAIFNVADVFISMGVVWMCLLILLGKTAVAERESGKAW